ncbi:Uncharacterised protein [Vibrio cholerae]|nr:Uncharacterised protein [Vibrio cholerae]CSD49976.1 Uncharacterised protein [Vibrio cholerae]CSH81396.1 Uncharacterised protein [Vibrio cholerae]
MLPKLSISTPSEFFIKHDDLNIGQRLDKFCFQFTRHPSDACLRPLALNRLYGSYRITDITNRR